MMLDCRQIGEIAESVAKTMLGPENVVRAFADPGVDLDGNEALDITLVIAPDALDRISGDAFVDSDHAIRTRLREARDERFAFFRYATEDELAAVDDPEC